jgi:hypothetical protein
MSKKERRTTETKKEHDLTLSILLPVASKTV